MNLSEIMNLLLGSSLVGTVVAIGSLRSTLRKAQAEAQHSEAEAESLRMDNSEHATRILRENIVAPLRQECQETRRDLGETKKELARNTREMARLRKAIDTASTCEHRKECPVIEKLHRLECDDAQPAEQVSAD